MDDGHSSSQVIPVNENSPIEGGHSSKMSSTQLSSEGDNENILASSNIDTGDVPTEDVLPNQLLNLNPSPASAIENADPSTFTFSQSNTTEITEPFTAFTLFPKLPAELQLRIWKNAIPGPRVIKLKTHVPEWLMNEPNSWPEDYDSAADNSAAIGALDFSTDTKPCELLGACKVSRAEILRIYRSVIESNSGKKIRFDGDNDTILFHAAKPLGHARSNYGGSLSTLRNYTSLFAGVKTLAWCKDIPLLLPMDYICWFISQFRSLDKFIFMNSMNFVGSMRFNPDYLDAWNKDKELFHAVRVTIRTHEEALSPTFRDLQSWLDVARRIDDRTRELQQEFSVWKENNAPQWKIPEITMAYMHLELVHDF